MWYQLTRGSGQVFYTYTYGSAIWLGLQAVPLVVLPKLVIMTLSEEGHQTSGKAARGTHPVHLCLSIQDAVPLHTSLTISDSETQMSKST
jgi:hypothetical protein